MILDEIKVQTSNIILELIEKAKLVSHNIIVIGCSSSEVLGGIIGKNSSYETALSIFEELYRITAKNNIYLACQCCEHLNRALVIEAQLAKKLNLEIVNAIPQPKAGGSLATAAYRNFNNPVLVEKIRADAGIDIGGTLIGMHLKETVVPLRFETPKIGEAYVSGARTRPKFIGGTRAVYDESLL